MCNCYFNSVWTITIVIVSFFQLYTGSEDSPPGSPNKSPSSKENVRQDGEEDEEEEDGEDFSGGYDLARLEGKVGSVETFHPRDFFK